MIILRIFGGLIGSIILYAVIFMESVSDSVFVGRFVFGLF
jgi:hypothetical protein